MPSLGELHPQNAISIVQKSQIRGHVGLRSRVRLYIRMIRSEELLCPLSGEILNLIGILASLIVPPPGISLGILVGDNRGDGLQYRRANIVLRRNHLKLISLSPFFPLHDASDLRIGLS
jgi:hypothetical protein